MSDSVWSAAPSGCVAVLVCHDEAPYRRAYQVAYPTPGLTEEVWPLSAWDGGDAQDMVAAGPLEDFVDERDPQFDLGRFRVFVVTPVHPAAPPFLGGSRRTRWFSGPRRYPIYVSRVPIVQYWVAAFHDFLQRDKFLAVAAVAAGLLRATAAAAGFLGQTAEGQCGKAIQVGNTWLWAVYQRYGIPPGGLNCSIWGALNDRCLFMSDYTHFFPGPDNCGDRTFQDPGLLYVGTGPSEGAGLMVGSGDLFHRPVGRPVMPIGDGSGCSS